MSTSYSHQVLTSNLISKSSLWAVFLSIGTSDPPHRKSHLSSVKILSGNFFWSHQNFRPTIGTSDKARFYIYSVNCCSNPKPIPHRSPHSLLSTLRRFQVSTVGFRSLVILWSSQASETPIPSFAPPIRAGNLNGMHSNLPVSRSING